MSKQYILVVFVMVILLVGCTSSDLNDDNFTDNSKIINKNEDVKQRSNTLEDIASILLVKLLDYTMIN